MTTSRRASHLVHDELGTPAEMAADGREVGRNLGLDARLERRFDRAARAAVGEPPSIRYEDYPAEVGKREVRISDAAARLADALHLRG